MRKWNKFLALLLAMVMAFSLTITAFAEGEDAETTETPSVEETEGESVEYNGTIVILHTNDVHGAIDGYAKVAALKAQYEAEGAYVLVMDAGDFIQGQPAVSISEGATAVELMNMVGYDVAIPGNHEFDYGYENLKTLAEKAEFPILAANITVDGKAALEENTVFTAPDGTTIGVFGLDTPETATKANPAKIQGVSFAAGEDMFAIAEEQVKALSDCDYVVCLGHLGIDEESTGNRSIDLLEKVTGIDLFIDGHSHSDLAAVAAATNEDRTVGETVVTSTGTALANIGVVTIKDGTITTDTVSTEEITVAEDDAIAARAAEINAEIDAEYGAKFAETEVDLNGERDPGNRTQETNLGDLIADALLWKAQEEGEKADVAITNGGGIRASIAAGDITKKDINTVLPFGNTLSIIKLTGAELLEALEASTYCTPTAVGAFPQVAGIEFTVDTFKTYDQGDQYPDSTYYGPKSINRVTITSVGGKEFDPEAVYTVATNDFMAAGGDTYYAFAAASANYDLGIAMDEVVMEYITEVLGGKVTAEQYGEPAGRITIKGYTDVTASNWYVDAVAYVTENDLMDGLTDTTFGPSEAMTRQMLVTALYRMAGSPEVTAENPFTDVAEDASYYNAVIWAYENGVVGGITDTTFEPDSAVTRQQMAAILYRYAGASVEEADLSAFTDADTISSYATEAMAWAVANGLFQGNADGTIAPKATATRAQVATILMRFAELPEVPAEETPDEETEAPAEETETPAEEETETPSDEETEAPTETPTEGKAA